METDMTTHYAEGLSLPDSPVKPTSLSRVFSHDHSKNDINMRLLYIALFNKIPCWIEQQYLDTKKARQWFVDHRADEIRSTYFNKRCLKRDTLAAHDDFIYVLRHGIIVHFDTDLQCVEILFDHAVETEAEAIHLELYRFRKRRNSRQIALLVLGSNGFDTVYKPLRPAKLSIADNYNDDFASVHQTILKRLRRPHDKGVVLLHGKPGTGKTSYIRYLVGKVNKKVFFLPPHMAASITNPDLIALLLNNSNSIFVIEDAENIIVDRQQDGQSAVSSLLNIADGLLSDCLNIQIICSFNTDLSSVDSALMRKGRLIASYEFNELDVDKAQRLSEKLGFQSAITQPMALTDIYNQDEESYKNTRGMAPVGFNLAKVG